MGLDSHHFWQAGDVLIHLPSQARFALNDDRTGFEFIEWGSLATADERQRMMVGHLAWQILKVQ